MTITMFISLLVTFSTVSGLVTQGVKKMLDLINIKYVSNILACIVACIVGIGGTSVHYVFTSIEFSATNVLCMFLMGICSALGSMVGYDKVIQTIKQLKPEPSIDITITATTDGYNTVALEDLSESDNITSGT